MKRLLLETVSLQTPRGRLVFFSVATVVIFFSHYHWLDHLSLWGHLGIHRAPSIGLTRAYWLLIHGRPTAAWHRNALIYVVIGIGIPLLARDFWQLVHQRTKKSPTPQTVL